MNKILSIFPISKFKEIQKLNPCWSSFSCFIETIKSKNISKPLLFKNFKKLVEKDDYAKDEMEEIMGYLRMVNFGEQIF